MTATMTSTTTQPKYEIVPVGPHNYNILRDGVAVLNRYGYVWSFSTPASARKQVTRLRSNNRGR